MSSSTDINPRVKVALVGDAEVGKSALLKRFVFDTFSDTYTITLGVDFEVRTMEIREELIKLLVWDFAGQIQFRVTSTEFYNGNDGYIAMYDVTNRMSFNGVPKMIEAIEKYAKGKPHIVLVGNKSDVDISDRAVSAEDGRKLAYQFNIPFFETSAKTGSNVDDVFLSTLLSVRRSVIHPTPPQQPSLLQRLFT